MTEKVIINKKTRFYLFETMKKSLIAFSSRPIGYFMV